jgi:hypothetical protein
LLLPALAADAAFMKTQAKQLNANLGGLLDAVFTPFIVLATCAVLLAVPAALRAQDLFVSAGTRLIPKFTNAGVTGNFATLLPTPTRMAWSLTAATISS